MTRTLCVCALFLVITFCKQANETSDNVSKYNYSNLRNAWVKKDTTFIKDWISGYKYLKFNDVVSVHNELANSLNFCYGYLDPEIDYEKYFDEGTREIIVANIIKVYSTYIKSCLLFNDRVDFESTLYLVDTFWNKKKLLTESDLNTLNDEFNRICTQAG